MSLITQIREIFIAQHAIDFRKGFNSLLAECYRMELDPYKGECVVFVHRSWTQLKAILGDERGLILVQRRFEGGAMKSMFPFLSQPSFVCISQAEVAMLFDGHNFTVHTKVRNWKNKQRP